MKRTLVDLDKLIKEKAPKFYKFLPAFFINILKRIIHQKDINYIISTYSESDGLDFVENILNHLNVDVTFSGLENLDKNKKYVFASNHPNGGLDGLGVLKTIGRKIGQSKAIINDILLHIEGLQPVFQGVNVYKGNTKEKLKEIDDLYKSENQIVVFPAGLVSRKIKGQIVDLKWKKSFLSKAIQHKRDLVPVYVTGKNSNFFYNFAKIRKFLGFKFNYELILLPKEFFGYKNKPMHIIFGKPISYEYFDNSKTIEEWVEYFRNEVYKLGKKL